jgi:hypothetical protein
MLLRNKSVVAKPAAMAVALAATTLAGAAFAADMTMPLKAPPPVVAPFFLVNDTSVSFTWYPNATDPGVCAGNTGNFPVAGANNKDGFCQGSSNGFSKYQGSVTHFDVWGYGTNFFTISMFKSDHNDPAAPCTGATPGQTQNNATINGFNTACAGATEVYGLFRSTFGWNEIFGTKMFSMGPLHNISFEIGGDVENENTFLAPAKRDIVGGLQFAFDLPYKGFFNVAPLAYKEINHNAFDSCGVFGAGTPGVTCLADGNTSFHTTWAVEINYYMDLGFLPENFQYFSVSGRAGFYGPKGDSNAPLQTNTPSKTEINSEPIRLTFDASKAFWGPKYTHFVDVWVAYRYWQNKFGLDHNGALGVCTALLGTQVVSTHSCTEQSASAGITVKF